jgi:hypothetical protein
MSPYEQLLNIVVSYKDDYDKSMKGNDSATRRVRLAMRDARDLAQEIRMQLQADKKSRKQLKIRTIQSNGGL